MLFFDIETEANPDAIQCDEIKCDECNEWRQPDKLDDDGVCEACRKYLSDDYRAQVSHDYYHDRI